MNQSPTVQEMGTSRVTTRMELRARQRSNGRRSRTFRRLEGFAFYRDHRPVHLQISPESAISAVAFCFGLSFANWEKLINVIKPTLILMVIHD